MWKNCEWWVSEHVESHTGKGTGSYFVRYAAVLFTRSSDTSFRCDIQINFLSHDLPNYRAVMQVVSRVRRAPSQRRKVLATNEGPKVKKFRIFPTFLFNTLCEFFFDSTRPDWLFQVVQLPFTRSSWSGTPTPDGTRVAPSSPKSRQNARHHQCEQIEEREKEWQLYYS